MDGTDPLPSPEVLGLYTALFDSSPDLIALVDRQYRYRMVNQAYSARYGKTPDQLVGSTIPQLLGNDVFRDSVISPLDLCFSGQPTSSRAWFTYPTIGPRYMEVRYHPLRDDGPSQYVVALSRDITDEKRSEDALRESEERYRALADFTYDWEHWLGPDGGYVYVSPSCERITGYRAWEFLADPGLLEKITHPDDREMVAQHLKEENQSSGDARQLDFRIITRGGQERWINHFCQPIYGRDGAWLGWRGSNRDNTEQRYFELALRASEERYRLLFNSVFAGFALLEMIRDKQGSVRDVRYLDLNPAGEKLLGFRRDEIIGRTVLEVYGSRDPDLGAVFGRAPSRGVPIHFEDTGRYLGRWWHLLVSSTGDEQVGMVFRDISHEKLAEDALRESEERFRRVFEDAPIGMAIVGPDHRFTRANPAFCKMTGYMEGELRQRTVEDITHPQDLNESIGLLSRVLGETSTYLQVKKRYIKKSGEVFWGNLTATTLRGPQQQPIQGLAMLEDITEHTKADQLKEQYVSFISHDLRAPLSVVIGQTSIVKARLAGKELEPEVERLDSVVQSAWRINAMIQDLLESSRLESGDWTMQRESTDLGKLVASTCDHAVSPEHKARLRVEMPHGMPPVQVDQERFERALANLITNALKYSPPDSPVIVALEQAGGGIQISVTDHGDGIPQEEQALVFDRFFRAAHRKKAEGLGLGLYITRLIVEAHGGKIWVKSTVGKGSTFGITLPASAP